MVIYIFPEIGKFRATIGIFIFRFLFFGQFSEIPLPRLVIGPPPPPPPDFVTEITPKMADLGGGEPVR